MFHQTESTGKRRSVRILVADDHTVVRKGICALLATESEIEVVGEAQNGEEAISKAHELQPDVILMDLVMPQVDGLEAIRRILARQPRTRILVLTSFGGDENVFPAIRAGAVGYLLKDSEPAELVRAIHQVYRGKASLHPIIARKLLTELSYPPKREMEPHLLTQRELEVLRWVAQGNSNREIADRLEIGVTTVRAHVSSILTKLKLNNRTQAALYALREGLASLNTSDPLRDA